MGFLRWSENYCGCFSPVEIMVNIGKKIFENCCMPQSNLDKDYTSPPGGHVAQEVCDPISFVDDWKGHFVEDPEGDIR